MIKLYGAKGEVIAWRHEWDNDEPDPTCQGKCEKRAWVLNHDTGYWVCSICRRPNPYNLVLCDYCEVIWLPKLASQLAKRNARTKELDHPACEVARAS